MSNAISPLQGEVYEGFCAVEDLGPRGMITLRGGLASVAVKNAATGVAGVDMPGVNRANLVEQRGIAWMSPDELLILCPYEEAAQVAATLSAALAAEHHLVANVSDARAVFALRGPLWREALAKLTPANVAQMGPGDMRRSRLAQVPAAFWLRDGDTVELVCFRSVARYVFNLLVAASRPGSEVGL